MKKENPLNFLTTPSTPYKRVWPKPQRTPPWFLTTVHLWLGLAKQDLHRSQILQSRVWKEVVATRGKVSVLAEKKSFFKNNNWNAVCLKRKKLSKFCLQLVRLQNNEVIYKLKICFLEANQMPLMKRMCKAMNINNRK
jgi:hypothetical protein